MAETDTWAHLAGVYDAGRNELRFYIDGTLTRSSTLTWTPTASTNALQAGRSLRHDTQGGYLRGGIDDLYVYQGALTDARIKNLYDAQLDQGVES